MNLLEDDTLYYKFEISFALIVGYFHFFRKPIPSF